MKYGEIIKLIEAGYSRDEILKMQDDQQEGQKEGQKEDPKEGQKEGQKEDPKEGHKEGQKDNLSGVMDEMKNIFSDFKNELQAMNIMYSQQKQEAETTPEDLIATIINPFDHDKKIKGGIEHGRSK